MGRTEGVKRAVGQTGRCAVREAFAKPIWASGMGRTERPEPKATPGGRYTWLPELGAGIGGGERPVCGGVVLVSLVLPGGEFGDRAGLAGDAPVEALAGQHAQFGPGQSSQLPCLGAKCHAERSIRRRGPARARASS
jgi:hypothetical protein